MDFIFFKLSDKIFPFFLNKSKEYICGSLPSCQIYLPFKGVSRQHFSLRYFDNKWVIEDLKSKNGTYLNGKKIQKEYLNYKDKIKVGIIDLFFYFKEDLPYINLDFSEIKKDIFFEGFAKETDTLERIEKFDEIYFLPGVKFPDCFIFGKSPSMYQVYREFSLSVLSGSNILFIGETGTGKEMFSRAYHLTKYNNDNFVEVNCAAIPSELAESELFGIKKGAATGVMEREGKIIKANNGTLLLDEIDSLSYEIQGKILRALEEKKIYPVGENKPVYVNFSLICTMQKNPSDLIKKNILREDLYHRISEVEINLPPLRERKEDIPLFIKKFLEDTCIKAKKPIEGISSEIYDLLLNYEYPGNIRELKNIIKEMVSKSPPDSYLDIDSLPDKVKSKILDKEAKEEKGFRFLVDQFSKKIIEEALKKTNYNISKAAEILKLSRRGLQKIIKRLKITKNNV